MLNAGILRHRITIQHVVQIEDSSDEVQDQYGSPDLEWQDFATVWAAIEPLSARAFIAAQAEQSKVIARVVIRKLPGIRAGMRILHEDKYYHIEGVLADKEAGLEYQTLPVSEGVRHGT